MTAGGSRDGTPARTADQLRSARLSLPPHRNFKTPPTSSVDGVLFHRPLDGPFAQSRTVPAETQIRRAQQIAPIRKGQGLFHSCGFSFARAVLRRFPCSRRLPVSFHSLRRATASARPPAHSHSVTAAPSDGSSLTAAASCASMRPVRYLQCGQGSLPRILTASYSEISTATCRSSASQLGSLCI